MAERKPVKLVSPPGYGPVVPLDRARHAGLGIRPGRSFEWAGRLNACYLNAVEFARAAIEFPIAFAREGRSKEFVPLAVLGLRDRQNLFVDAQGHWREHAYVPAYLRRHPFCIAQLPATNGAAPQRLVCVQEDQLAAGAPALIDAKGQPTALWPPILKLLEAVEDAHQATRLLAKRLESLDLLVPFDAVATPAGGKPMRLSGMYRVDEPRLEKIGARELRTLLQKHELRAIYAHLVSLENFARLMDYAVLRGRGA